MEVLATKCTLSNRSKSTHCTEFYLLDYYIIEPFLLGCKHIKITCCLSVKMEQISTALYNFVYFYL